MHQRRAAGPLSSMVVRSMPCSRSWKTGWRAPLLVVGAELGNDELVGLEKKYFLPVGKRLPVTLVRGEGVTVWDINGKSYLDFVAGIAAVSLGHCHPEVVKAIERQARTLMHTSNYYYTIPQVKLAQLLCESA